MGEFIVPIPYVKQVKVFPHLLIAKKTALFGQCSRHYIVLVLHFGDLLFSFVFRS